MCNETKKNNDEEQYDYRFLDYRLNQYETKLDKGLEKLEQGQKNNYTEIMKTLRLMQEGNNEQNKTLIELNQRIQVVEQKINCIDRLKEVTTKHGEEIRTLYKRLDIYKQLLMAIGGGAGVALLIEIIKFI